MDSKSNSFQSYSPPLPPPPLPPLSEDTSVQEADKTERPEIVLQSPTKEDTNSLDNTTEPDGLNQTPDTPFQNDKEQSKASMEMKNLNPYPLENTVNQASSVTETDLNRFMAGSSTQPQGNLLERQNQVSDEFSAVGSEKAENIFEGRTGNVSNSETISGNLGQKSGTTPEADMGQQHNPRENGNETGEVIVENTLYVNLTAQKEGESPATNGTWNSTPESEIDRDHDEGKKKDGIRSINEDPEMSMTLNDDDEDVVYSLHDLRGENVSLKSHILSMWYLVVIILTPIIFLPIILLIDDEFQKEARCGYIIAVMAVYWTTEAMPIAVTSLLPVVLLPSLGVLTAKQTSESYFRDTSMLFVGGLLVAITIEVWDVHKRIALLVLKIVGAEPKCLLLGVTLVTWFLSMWISNTATTAMMMTIVQALLAQFKTLNDQDVEVDLKKDETRYGTIARQNSTSSNTSDHKKPTPGQSLEEYIRLSKALSLTVAYAANIGGIGSLTGTGPNLVLFAKAQEVFEKQGLTSPISFSTWMVYGLPLSMVLVMVMWLWIVLIYLRCKDGCRCCCCSSSANSEQIERVNKVIRDEYENLGPITYAQWSVIASFILLVVMWITRDLGGVGGWGSWFPKGFVSDSTPSLLMGILMFILPSTFPSALRTKCDKRKSYKKVQPLLTWKHVHEKMPWTLYLLLGGGYAIASASTESGLSQWLGQQLLVFRDMNQWGVLLIICYIVTFATEVTSNTAMATLMMPVLSQMAISLELNPLFFMFPAAITTSFAFMLPVATPPNAIVFSHGNLRVIDMTMTGFVLNVISVPLLLMATATWGNAFFGFDQVPAAFTNQTLTTVASLIQRQ